MDRTKILINLPFFLKSVLINIEGIRTSRNRFKGRYKSYLRQFENGKDKKMSKNEMFIALKPILDSIPFYKSLEISDFDEIPIVNKEIIKNSQNDFIVDIRKKKEDAHTSGTSGSAFKFPVSSSIIEKHFASYNYFRLLNGLSFKDTNANILGRTFLKITQKSPPFWVYNRSRKQLLLSQYHISEDTVNSYLAALKKYKVKWLHAYPSTLAAFSNLVLNRKLQDKVEELELSGISLSSETLYDDQRELIEKAFSTKVYNYYCQVESVAAIYECPEGNLHVNESFSYVEFIKDEESGFYRIVGTQLDNKCLPFIRYDTKDLVELDEKMTCSCGSKGRIVKRIVGRQDDYITLLDGRRIGRLDHIFKETPNILEAQIRQYTKGQAEFWIVVDNNYNNSEVEKELINQIRQKLGDDFKYEILYKESIPRTKNGKLKLVVSDVN